MNDAIIIGGGFYGAAISIYLKRQRGFNKVLLIDREPDLLRRASYNNQARVHNGYHYPRSFSTAFRSRVNLPRFVQDYPLSIKRDFMMLYAIARRNSKVTASQFSRFCYEIGARLEPASKSHKMLFDTRLIEAVFQVEEYVFDVCKLVDRAKLELKECGIEVRLNSRAMSIKNNKNSLMVECDGIEPTVFNGRYVFNCAYSGLNQYTGDFPGTQIKLKHEVAEMALMQVPYEMLGLGVTVMDGPFFSMMPFPVRGLHTLSHVRYTPHFSWLDQAHADPYQRLTCYHHETHVDRMVRDARRYMPALAKAKYVESLFEVKTILVKNEGDDGRPILFERHASLPNCYSILGGKIDNVYDVLEKLDTESFSLN